MEVTTVSPSPASPTEGDDLCDIDVTNEAIHSVTLLISLCGLAGNGAVLCLLSLNVRNSGIFDLAFADFLFLLFTVATTLLFLVEDMSCSLIMPLPYLSFLFQLTGVSYYWALLRLMVITNNLNLYKLCMLCYRCDRPKRLWWLVYSVQYWAFLALFTVILAVTNLCPSHRQEHCRGAVNSMYALILLIFAAPLVISVTMNFIKAKRGSRRQQAKRHNIVIFLIVLLIVLLILYNFLQPLGYTLLSSQVVFLLNCIHSSIKPFIYFLVGRCWRPCSLKSLRLSLQRVFDEEEGETAHSNDASMDTGV
ncbi:mas-related G-protein coupled receptor member B4-like [Prinia subflava]|uniref:mas-related G-protein coupled receptor member B4-like n=1 Tax=Prinia subflava TaxID=208062 RepID=UPI002FE3C2E3